MYLRWTMLRQSAQHFKWGKVMVTRWLQVRSACIFWDAALCYYE